ncbi:toxin-antitoxin system HicB family antitoxin [Tsukamurella tyrosinosolvens]|uniref:toxin-antitoxin system HicB family antitoxin n=1 Tax=Tsukamurella tyrosinosolvens TaxID=57704 RepID=UPI00079610A6|nr:toxin-antitoxin system HicB family antitoxin [Tsukamurella tyrosinosolvens]KXP07095.1 hisitidine kinase [Tsukamurella tyrosinosolvens]KZL98296.1 hisitidine kinase [Tsukamurella tyrosinosolvens]MCA4994464.1 toxin-antitoxin system HicB family antitoxin [Tsukamurella tyrosinosolvens]WEL92484.1 toxin-antitoxin system HicB family antitoxin [Tsukamurella tyrosinosolvens]
MDITPFVSDLQRQLIAAAERDFTDAGDNGVDDARASAERLASGLDATTRLVLLDALSAATGEITRDLVPGSVDLRLRGRDVEFVVSAPRAEAEEDSASAPGVDFDDTSTSRTTLRLPDALKSQVDEAAAAEGVSVNTWLVRAVAAALAPRKRRTAQRVLRTGDDFAGWAR